MTALAHHGARRSVRCIATLAAAVVITWASTGCGAPRDAAAPIPRDDVPFDLLSPADVSAGERAPGEVTSTIYLTVDEEVVGVPRQLPTPVSPAAILAEVVEGPTVDEEAFGISTELDADALGSVRAGGGLLQVELRPDREPSSGSTVLAVAQVVLSLTESDPELRVAFLEDGEPLAVPLPDGRTTDRPVGRSDYLELVAD